YASGYYGGGAAADAGGLVMYGLNQQESGILNQYFSPANGGLNRQMSPQDTYTLIRQMNPALNGNQARLVTDRAFAASGTGSLSYEEFIAAYILAKPRQGQQTRAVAQHFLRSQTDYHNFPGYVTRS